MKRRLIPHALNNDTRGSGSQLPAFDAATWARANTKTQEREDSDPTHAVRVVENTDHPGHASSIQLPKLGGAGQGLDM